MKKINIKSEWPELTEKGVTAIMGCGIVNREQAGHIAKFFDKAIDKIDAKSGSKQKAVVKKSGR